MGSSAKYYLLVDVYNLVVFVFGCCGVDAYPWPVGGGFVWVSFPLIHFLPLLNVIARFCFGDVFNILGAVHKLHIQKMKFLNTEIIGSHYTFETKSIMDILMVMLDQIFS